MRHRRFSRANLWDDPSGANPVFDVFWPVADFAVALFDVGGALASVAHDGEGADGGA